MMISNLETLPLNAEKSLESIDVLKKLSQAHRYLAELKGIAKSIPNEGILISTLTLQEAKDSSAIENIYTTHNELFQSEVLQNNSINPATKEVENYRKAVWESYRNVKITRLIRYGDILNVQKKIEPNKPGIRKIPGTVIGSRSGAVIYQPPQHPDDIERLLSNLVDYVNNPSLSELDPLIKMAIIHHQFESIHPFYDGNGRTGRILNILYLVLNDLLDLPILYLSRHIVKTKDRYYDLLQNVRDEDSWTDWILYMLECITVTAKETIIFVQEIHELVVATKIKMRAELPKIYSQELLNNLFYHPYTKVQFIIDQLGVSRITAAKYLDELKNLGIVSKHKIGRTNYYINESLVTLITNQEKS